MAEDPMLAKGVPERERPHLPHDASELEQIRDQARAAAAVASEMKAEEIRLLEMHELVTYTDFLVVCSGRTVRQTRRISEEVALKLKRERGLRPAHVEGDQTGEWILMDYLDFIVHVFTPEAREFYRLDTLWKDAPAETID
jgi:ribosome-associated protein